jgi:transcriptional regulator with XRE-family HTH domain
MARKTLKITPEQVKSLRQKTGLTQKQAAETVHVSARQWQKFEEIETSGTYVRIGDATLELFCIKSGLSFPPQFNDGYHHGKVISFAGGAGGVARSSLTRDMAISLTNDGYDVLVVTSKEYSQLKSAEKYFLYSNQPYPKILFEEDIQWEGRSYFNSSFSDILGHYDFIFIDLEAGGRYLRVSDFPVDLIITPGRFFDRFHISISNSQTFYRRKQEGLFAKNSTKIAFLLIGVVTDYTFNFNSYVGDSFTDEQVKEALYYPEYYRKTYQKEFADLYELEREGVYVFNAYTTSTYDFYTNLARDIHKGNEAVMHYLDNPNTIAAHDLRAIKKELLMLLGITG